ncbi:MAG: hypothetical protein OEV42_21265 [Deltaproteobacteria bacterium]|nr:hypothetical protein [Deltaproteobacteria bacterium]
MLQKLLLSLIIVSITAIALLGCQKNETTVAPYGSGIVTNPTEWAYSVHSSALHDSQKFYINIFVLDENGVPQNNQDLFFYCDQCEGGMVTLADNKEKPINVSASAGDVHGTTGNFGNYILWVNYITGGGINYTTEIRITSGTNDAFVELAVDDDFT